MNDDAAADTLPEARIARLDARLRVTTAVAAGLAGLLALRLGFDVLLFASLAFRGGGEPTPVYPSASAPASSIAPGPPAAGEFPGGFAPGIEQAPETPLADYYFGTQNGVSMPPFEGSYAPTEPVGGFPDGYTPPPVGPEVGSFPNGYTPPAADPAPTGTHP